MSTDSASKFVTARKAKICVRCQHGIDAGQEYLSYRPGLKTTIAVCVTCASGTASTCRAITTTLDGLASIGPCSRKCV